MHRTPAPERDETVASNLTRDEARERARLLNVESYRVELDLTGGDLTFDSITTVFADGGYTGRLIDWPKICSATPSKS